MLFFCNRKAAYDVLISGWISDVCSSDLVLIRHSSRQSRPMPKIISTVHARRIRLEHANPDGEVMSKQKSSKDAPGAMIEIGIDKAVRKNIADGLSRLLADEYTLYLKTHNFHWNVEIGRAHV